MARDLHDTISTVFNCCNFYSYSWRLTDDNSYNKSIRYMEVPITSETFELPVMAVREFNEMVRENRDLFTGAIVLKLFTRGIISSYKSIDCVMRDNLRDNFNRNRLRVTKVGNGQNARTYYTTNGAVFDSNFKPVFMCSYIMKRCFPNNENDLCTYKFIRPVMTVSPHMFVEKADGVQKVISNKLITYCLEDTITTPEDYINACTRILGPSSNDKVKVQFDEIPFTLHDTPAPSISTTNEQLLQTAIDHIDNEFSA